MSNECPFLSWCSYNVVISKFLFFVLRFALKFPGFPSWPMVFHMLIPLYPDHKIAIWLSFPSDSFTSKILKHLKTSNPSIASYRKRHVKKQFWWLHTCEFHRLFGSTSQRETSLPKESMSISTEELGSWSPPVDPSWSIWKWGNFPQMAGPLIYPLVIYIT